jgi:hypothetical protein
VSSSSSSFHNQKNQHLRRTIRKITGYPNQHRKVRGQAFCYPVLYLPPTDPVYCRQIGQGEARIFFSRRGNPFKLLRRSHGYVSCRHTCLHNYVNGKVVIGCIYVLHQKTSITFKSWHIIKNAYLQQNLHSTRFCAFPCRWRLALLRGSDLSIISQLKWLTCDYEQGLHPAFHQNH